MGNKQDLDDDVETELDLGDDEEELADADRGDDAPEDPSDEDLKAVAGDDDDDEDEGDDADDEDKGSKHVPHARFNEVNEKRIRAEERARLLEEENARLKGGGKAKESDGEEETPAVDLKALRKQRNEALMEGDSDKAAELDEQIDAEVERRAVEKAAAAAETSILTRQARQEFAGAVAESIEKYPFLDAKGEQANAKAIAEVVEWRDFYIAKGKSPAEALRQAVGKVGPQYAPKKGGKADADDDDDGDEGDDGAESRAALRRKLALRRNADAANRQPARPGGVGERSSAAKLKVEDLSDDEFDKLPEKAKRELRGDAM